MAHSVLKKPEKQFSLVSSVALPWYEQEGSGGRVEQGNKEEEKGKTRDLARKTNAIRHFNFNVLDWK